MGTVCVPFKYCAVISERSEEMSGRVRSRHVVFNELFNRFREVFHAKQIFALIKDIPKSGGAIGWIFGMGGGGEVAFYNPTPG